MSVTARMFVQEITRRAHQKGVGIVKLSAVSRGPENKSWAASTPSGTIELQIANEAALAFFDESLGEEMVIDIHKRPPICPFCHEEIPYNSWGQYNSSGVDWCCPTDEWLYEVNVQMTREQKDRGKNLYPKGSVLHNECRDTIEAQLKAPDAG